jgi:nucleoside-diphosphate-sugar epimerase
MPRILVTGATGFVGRFLAAELARCHELTLAARSPLAGHDSLAEAGVVCAVGDIAVADWGRVLEGCTGVIHLAGRAHVFDRAGATREAFDAVNLEGTRRLARMAAEAGVARFVHLSTIKVLGESTTDKAFCETDPPCPQDPYAESKSAAESALRAIGRDTGMQIVILRPPLVYGPGVGANFLRLMRWVARGVPLPFGSVSNRRSLVYVGNLVHALDACLVHPAAAGRIFHVTDGAALATGELCAALARALRVHARLLPVPPAVLRLLGVASGRSAQVARLLDSLEVDDAALRTELQWSPPYSVEQGLAATAAWFSAAGR